MRTDIKIPIKCFENTEETIMAKNQIDEILSAIRSMDLNTINELLDEEIQSTDSGKYFLLAVLRDLFMNYEKLGDDEVTLELGRCDKVCYSNTCVVFNLNGNKSGKDFAFVIENKNDELSGIHVCPKFIDSNNTKRPIDNDLYYDAIKKKSEMKNKRKPNWNDERAKSQLSRLRDIL